MITCTNDKLLRVVFRQSECPCFMLFLDAYYSPFGCFCLFFVSTTNDDSRIGPQEFPRGWCRRSLCCRGRASSRFDQSACISLLGVCYDSMKMCCCFWLISLCIVDPLQVRMQTAGAGGSTSVLGMLSHTFAKEGITGIYRGASAPLVSISFIFAVCFCKIHILVMARRTTACNSNQFSLVFSLCLSLLMLVLLLSLLCYTC